METQSAPKLAAPGAGLPLIESLVVRYYYGGWVSARSDSSANLDLFEKLNAAILKNVARLDLGQLHARVLVPKLPGIEDSSRFWSVAETLEHIEIVGDKMSDLIEQLALGETPQQAVAVADFKPQGKYVGKDARPGFADFSARTLAKLRPLEIAHTGPRFKHPWMGKLSARQWSWVLASHSGLHLRQTKHILAGIA